MISKAKTKQTLSDKIAGILSTAPANFDPEDDIHEETTARVTENPEDDIDNDEVVLSSFRKQNVELLEDVDKKYVGKKATRKSLNASDDDWETEDEGLSTDEGEALDGVSGTQEYVSDDEDESDVESGDDEDEDQDDEDDDEEDFEDGHDIEDIDDSNFKHMSETNVSGQAKKGNSVRNELNMWENLLEIRIQLQKCLITSNKMPQFDVFKEFENDKEFKSAAAKTKRNITEVLNKFLTLQFLLLKQFPETKSLLNKDKNKSDKQESDEEIPSDSDVEDKSEKSDSEEEIIPKKRKKLSDLSEEISTRYNKYKDYRNNIIQKWNDKTRLSVGKNNQSQSIIQHINFILDDKNKLIKRTQQKRSDYKTIGKLKEETDSKTKETNELETEENNEQKTSEQYDTEIFDDDDFYHQLLRELIEFKSSGITDPIQMSRQWIQLQNLRSKMKRKIDTRATKGRKIRYVVHSKLVNFMAPMDNSSWTEEAKNELFTSLFGGNQPTTSV